jgi:hypothetical protein
MAGGSWGASGNWQGSQLPDNGHANLTLTGVTYTVTYDAVAPAISNLVVSNKAPYRTALVISSTLTNLGGAAIRIKDGATVTVTNGGLWTYVGTNSVTDSNTPMLLVDRGGTLELGGGTVLFTNLLRTGSYRNYIYVGNQSTGTLRIAGGRLEYWGRSSATANGTHGLTIGRQAGGLGVMDMHGGTVILGNPNAGDTTLSIGAGATGTLTLAGGTLAFTNNVWNAFSIGSASGVAGSGLLVVTNTGTISGPNMRTYVGDGAGCLGVARLAGGTATVSTVYIGNINATGASTGQLDIAGGTLNNAADLFVCYPQGGGRARGTLNISAGSIAVGSYWGLMVGQSRTGHTGAGDLNISGGALRVNSGYNYGSGLMVGYIPENDNNAATRATGSAFISGGAVTNSGMLIVGYNGATGTVVQSGGAVVLLSSVANLTAIGYGTGASTYFKGGWGAYTVNGGSYYTPNRTFVGGVPTNVVALSNTGSVGRLTLTGGNFTCSNTVYVGALGAGTVAVATNGYLQANDLVFSNNTASTLRFDVGGAGTGRIKVNSSLTIAAGARLEVDARDFAPPVATNLVLVDCASRIGVFTDIAIQKRARSVEVDQTTPDIILKM